MNEQEFMQQAINNAIENMHGLKGGPFGAVIVKDGIIIAEAANTVTTSNDPTAHAEVNAIRLAAKKLGTFDLSGCEIYTSCEPCPMCLAAIYWARISKIYYSGSRYDAQDAGFDDSFIYDEFSYSIEERKVKMQQLLPEEGKKILDNWKEIEGKIDY